MKEYQFPDIIVLRILSDLTTYNLYNIDEVFDGYLEITLQPNLIRIDRWFFERWHQCMTFFHPKKYQSALEYQRNTQCAGTLTRYRGQTYVGYDEYPVYEIDEPMSYAVHEICKDYYNQLYQTAPAITIQRHVRGYLTRKRHNLQKKRLMGEIRALPSKVIVDWFEGGIDYQLVASKWKQT